MANAKTDFDILLAQESPNYLDVKLKTFKEVENKEFRLVQNLTTGEADFNQFMQLRNQLVTAAKTYSRGQNLLPVLIPTLSKDLDEQFKLAHKVIDIVDPANRKTFLNLLPYNLEESKSSNAQVPLFSKKKEDGKFQQAVYVKNRLEQFIYLLEVLNSVYDKVITDQCIYSVL